MENLTLSGAGDINSIGNELDNTMTGNGGANRLYGVDGNDTIDGGGGSRHDLRRDRRGHPDRR